MELVRQLYARGRQVVQKASPEQVLRWAKRILSASSVDEVFAT